LKGLTPNSIIHGFAETGLFPWDEAKFRGRFTYVKSDQNETRLEEKLNKIRLKSLKEVVKANKLIIKEKNQKKRRASASQLPALGSSTILALEARYQLSPPAKKARTTPIKNTTSRLARSNRSVELPTYQASTPAIEELADVEPDLPEEAEPEMVNCFGCFEPLSLDSWKWRCSLCQSSYLCSVCCTSEFLLRSHACRLGSRRNRVAKLKNRGRDDFSIVEISSTIQ
jgi:hypothetical protein